MTDKEKEILSILQEECAEVIQAVSKCFRFGFESVHQDKNNLQRLEDELGDLQCMISLLLENEIVNENNLNKAELNKFQKLQKWSNIFADTK